MIDFVELRVYAFRKEKMFIPFEEVKQQIKKRKLDVPIVRARVWAGEERNATWTVECQNLKDFIDVISTREDKIRFLAFDESIFDDEFYETIQEDLSNYAQDEGISNEWVGKALTALQSHREQLIAVALYAFFESGPVLLMREQSELAKLLSHPHRLLSEENLSKVRKLKTIQSQVTT